MPRHWGWNLPPVSSQQNQETHSFTVGPFAMCLLPVPRAIGGHGQGMTGLVTICEILAQESASTALCCLGSATGDPSHLMRDGTEIRREITERHVLQRLGWDAHAMRMEFRLLREAILAVLTRPAATASISPHARSLVDGFINQAEQRALKLLGLPGDGRRQP